MNPTIFLGLGAFGKEVAQQHFETIKVDEKKHFSFFSIDKYICAGSRAGVVEQYDDIVFDFSDDKTYKENLSVFLKSKTIVKNYLYTAFSNLEELDYDSSESNEISVLIYFGLSECCSSSIILEILDLIKSHPSYNNIRFYLFGFNYDLFIQPQCAKFEDYKKRSYACLTELDDKINSGFNNIASFSIFSSKLSDSIHTVKKSDLKSVLFEVSSRIIFSKEFAKQLWDISTNKTNKKKLIYNSYGVAALRYDPNVIWSKVGRKYKMDNLKEIISESDDSTILRSTIVTNVNKFIQNVSKDAQGQSFTITAHLEEIYKKLLKDKDDVPYFQGFSKYFSENGGFQVDTKNWNAPINQYIEKFYHLNTNFQASQWNDTINDANNGAINIREWFEKKVHQKLLNFDSFTDKQLARLYASLNQLLSFGATNLKGEVYVDEYGYKDLVSRQLDKFKFYYNLFPENKNETVGDIVNSDQLREKERLIISLKTDIDGKKERIESMNKFFFDETLFNSQKYEEGYFTINGENVDINGCKRLENKESLDGVHLYKSKILENEIANFVSLKKYLNPIIEDQLQEMPTCTANAISTAIEYLSKRKTDKFFDASRLFLFYNARMMHLMEYENKTDTEAENLLNVDENGTYLYYALKAAEKYGVCLEKTWPYVESQKNKKPSATSYAEAEDIKIDKFQIVDPNLHDMLSCLNEGFPFVFGLKLFDSFSTSKGKIELPKAGEKPNGNHAMICVGYNKKDQYFIVRNSWGTKWGDKGYCYIPFEYMTNTEYISEIFTIRDINEEVNQKCQIDIFEEGTTVLDDGQQFSQEIDIVLEGLKQKKQELDTVSQQWTSLRQTFTEQNEYFGDSEHRKQLGEKIEKVFVDKNIKIETDLRQEHDKGLFVDEALNEKKREEKDFIKKMLIIPFAIWLFIFLIIGFGISQLAGSNITGWKAAFNYLLEPFVYIGDVIANDPGRIFRPGQFIVGSFTIFAFTAWFTYAVYQWFKRFFVPISQLKKQLKNSINKILDLSNILQQGYVNLWNQKYDYFIDNLLYTEVLQKVEFFLRRDYKSLKEFVQSLKNNLENVAKSYIEEQGDTKFMRDIISVADSKKIDSLISDLKKHFDDKGFTPYNENMVVAFQDYKKNPFSFKKKFENHWSENVQHYQNRYTLKILLDKDIFGLKKNVDADMKFLTHFSKPLINLVDQRDKAKQVELNYKDSADIRTLYSASDNSFKAKLTPDWHNVQPLKDYQRGDENTFTIVCSISLFSPDAMKDFVAYKNLSHKELKEYFIYETDHNIFD